RSPVHSNAEPHACPSPAARPWTTSRDCCGNVAVQFKPSRASSRRPRYRRSTRGLARDRLRSGTCLYPPEVRSPDLEDVIGQFRRQVQVLSGLSLLLNVLEHAAELFLGESGRASDLLGGHRIVLAVEAQVHSVVRKRE